MSDYTPGPWVANPLGIDHESNMIFASTLRGGARRLVAIASTGAQAPANRCLLSAAPELLEALVRLKIEVVLSDIAPEYIESHFRPWLDKAESAITKALTT